LGVRAAVCVRRCACGGGHAAPAHNLVEEQLLEPQLPRVPRQEDVLAQSLAGAALSRGAAAPRRNGLPVPPRPAAHAISLIGSG
jgi:hypothetical protein